MSAQGASRDVLFTTPVRRLRTSSATCWLIDGPEARMAQGSPAQTGSTFQYCGNFISSCACYGVCQRQQTRVLPTVAPRPSSQTYGYALLPASGVSARE